MHNKLALRGEKLIENDFFSEYVVLSRVKEKSKKTIYPHQFKHKDSFEEAISLAKSYYEGAPFEVETFQLMKSYSIPKTL